MGYSPWGHKELDTTERLNDNDLTAWVSIISCGPVLILSCVCSGLRVCTVLLQEQFEILSLS